MLKRFKTWLYVVTRAIAKVKSDRANRKYGSQWDSDVLAASEELLDDHDLGVTIQLPTGTTYDAVVSYILTAACHMPDYDIIAKHLTHHFKLEVRDASRTIDRTLGGVARAAHRQSKFCPDPVRDPIAWHSFKKASHDYYFVQDIYHGYILPDNEGNSVKIKPRIYADFNGIIRGTEEDWIVLDCRGTVNDLERLGLEFKEGLEALFYSDDSGDIGNPDDIQAEGVMKYDPQYKWVGVIEWDKIHHASDRRVDK